VKLLWLLLLACIACRMLAGGWPWQLLGRATRSSDEAQARAVLGVRRDATREEIVDAHRRLIARVHPDRGGSGEQAHAANAARDLLLNRLPTPTER
jgi:DnaJ family protein C protein 19